MTFERIKQTLLDEIKLPDFKGRHLFIARLRLILFLLTWVLLLLFYPQVWSLIPEAPLIFNLGFLVTAICYWFVLQEKHILLMGGFEVVSDILSQTIIIYILGADSVVVFLLYGMYVVAAGNFFGYMNALLAASVALVFYCGLLFFISVGWVDPFSYPVDPGSSLGSEGFGYIFNLFFLPVALSIMVYGTKISYFFTKLKEEAVKTRNTQLLALNEIGSTIRKPLDRQVVVEQVIKGVIQGLGFDVCFLALKDKKQNRVRLYYNQLSPLVRKVEKLFGAKLNRFSLPIDGQENAILKCMAENSLVIRNDFYELVKEVDPEVNPEQAQLLQNQTGFKKFVITPLLAEEEVIGAMVGASVKSYVDGSIIDTLDNFANQAALALESATLFEELKEKNLELEEANKVKSDFLAIMSHELRTPLTAIIGYSEILLEGGMGDLNTQQKEPLSEVLRNGHNLLNLINNILDLAKMESGKMELNSETFSISDIIHDVEQTVSPLVAKKQQQLVSSINDSPLIKADPAKLRQVLLNLVGNAIKFTPEQGRIEISVDYAPSIKVFNKEFKPTSYFPKGVFRVGVKDTGIGIQKENLDRIFELFQQVDSTFTRKYQGTGLGLALSQQLVELHGGIMAVDSEYGVGSEFKFLLPEEPVFNK